VQQTGDDEVFLAPRVLENPGNGDGVGDVRNVGSLTHLALVGFSSELQGLVEAGIEREHGRQNFG
jgi:hypothetical protein